MAKLATVPVVGLKDLDVAKMLAGKGRYHEAAGVLCDFCWANSTLQGERGEVWSAIKLAALRLLSATSATVGRVMLDVTRAYPHLRDARDAD
jgi:hypothetical protein